MGFKKQRKTKGIQISQTKKETLLALGPLPDTLASSFGDSLRVLKGRGPLLQPDHSRNKIRGIPYVELWKVADHASISPLVVRVRTDVTWQ